MKMVNITQFKSQILSYLHALDIQNEDIILTRHQNPFAVVIPLSKYQDTVHKKKKTKTPKNKPSRFDAFVGLLDIQNVDTNWKKTRGNYLITRNIKDFPQKPLFVTTPEKFLKK